MKTTRHSNPPRAAREKKERVKQNVEQTLHACESVAARIKTAGEELAASWTALCQEISTGASSTELLRKRAWCNVLELRLKEQSYALEQARHGVDALWDEMMLNTRARELFNRYLKRDRTDTLAANDNLPLLARTASVIAAAHRRAAPLKK
jgi:flagellar biosynthesis chaperone FliJ